MFGVHRLIGNHFFFRESHNFLVIDWFAGRKVCHFNLFYSFSERRERIGGMNWNTIIEWNSIGSHIHLAIVSTTFSTNTFYLKMLRNIEPNNCLLEIRLHNMRSCLFNFFELPKLLRNAFRIVVRFWNWLTKAIQHAATRASTVLNAFSKW